MFRTLTIVMATVVVSVGSVEGADRGRQVVVTSSNATNNQLLVYDTDGVLVQTVATLGQGGVDANAGGIAASEQFVAVVNFASQSVSIFSQDQDGFQLRQVMAVASPPVSVAFGKDHLYVLGTTSVESHRVAAGDVDAAPDGVVPLLAADGSAAQVGVAGNQLVVTEKSGSVELVRLQDSAAVGFPVAVTLPADGRDTPFGLVTRGSNAYVTIAHSDLVALVKNGQLTALAATGSPGGSGEHSPCWIAVAGPYLFTANSPSRSISRLVAGGDNILLDRAVAAQTGGAPIDIAADNSLLAVVESNAGGTSHLTQFRVDENGDLTQTTSVAIASAANGVAILARR